MSDGLIKRLRDIGEEETGYGIRNEAAALIEQQAAKIAALEAQIATVAPAVDAQPVAWRHKATKILRNDSIAKGADFEPADWEPLYTAAQSEGLRKDAIRREALEQAAKLCDEKAVDYERDFEPARSIAAERCADAIRALSQQDPQ